MTVRKARRANGGRDVYGGMVDAVLSAGLTVNLFYCLPLRRLVLGQCPDLF